MYDTTPSLFKQDAPLKEPLKPALKIKHNCQTGRYVTIFKAQWCQNADLPPHFTVSLTQVLGIFVLIPWQIGNMKKRVSVYSGLTGALVADLAHPSYVIGSCGTLCGKTLTLLLA